VPYSNKEASCYVCKEKFDVFFDDEEETWFYAGVKQMKSYTAGGGQNKKQQTLLVHASCLKQIEMSRDIAREPMHEIEEEKEVDGKEEHKPIDIQELEKQIRGF
jgi:hypothetical protein